MLAEKQLGVVAHFYMDPEVQGVLAAAAARWPHINVSDSLVMADAAVRMAEAGCKAIAVLGVDFMSENVRAILDEGGFHDVQARDLFVRARQGAVWLSVPCTAVGNDACTIVACCLSSCCADLQSRHVSVAMRTATMLGMRQGGRA